MACDGNGTVGLAASEQEMNDIKEVVTESAFARGWADAKQYIGSVWFWVVEVAGGGYVGIVYGASEAVGAVLAFALLVIAAAAATAPVRQRDDARRYARQLIPQLELSFDAELGGIIDTPEKIRNPDGSTKKEYDATYVRIRVRAKSSKTVHNCSPFLIDVKKLDQRGTFVETRFIDPLQSPWSLLGVGALDIPPGVSRSVDVLYCTTRRPDELYFCGVWPLTLREFFKDHTTYRLTLLVAGDDVTETITIDVRWNGDRKGLLVQKV